VEFEPEAGLILERNPFYHGEFPGNVSRYENTFLLESDDVLQAYCRNRVDLIFGFHKQLLPGHFPAEEIQPQRPLFVWYIFLDPSQAPLDDIRIRQALALSFNRDRLKTEFSLAGGRGGFIPPGMPGHSPELAPRYDLETAQRLLEEAGYPGGLGFPLLKGIQRYSKINPIFDQMVQSIGAHWQRDLGINIEIEQVEGWSNREEPISFLTWTADYPDPDNFLRRSNLMDKIKKIGWEGSEYQELLETAAHLPNRAKRMALYRQADRLIVADQVIMLPCHQFPNIVNGIILPDVHRRSNDYSPIRQGRRRGSALPPGEIRAPRRSRRGRRRARRRRYPGGPGDPQHPLPLPPPAQIPGARRRPWRQAKHDRALSR
jgi:oligopeptide transport system substrate-binding protein